MNENEQWLAGPDVGGKNVENEVAEALLSLAPAQGLALSAEMVAQLARYAALLRQWNARMNLTSITEPKEMAVKHFLDSLMLVQLPEYGADVVDVGSGAGFPGMVAKLARPEVAVTLMEPSGKRQLFLQAVAAELRVRVELVKERAEEAARKGHRECYGMAVSRAVAALPALCEYCLPLVRVGGHFVAMKGDVSVELAAARRAIKKLGGRLCRVQPYSLSGAGARCLVVIEKCAKSPALYPRAGGVIKKRPL